MITYITSESKPDMVIRSSIQQTSLLWIDTFQKHLRISLLLKVDQVLIIVKDLDICKTPPSSLNFLSCDRFLSLTGNFLFPLSVTSPRPLYLDSRYMIHSKPMVLKKSACQTHLVRSLDEGGTEVLHAVLFIFVELVEGRSQKLLPQLLSRCQVLHFTQTARFHWNLSLSHLLL